MYEHSAYHCHRIKHGNVAEHDMTIGLCNQTNELAHCLIINSHKSASSLHCSQHWTTDDIGIDANPIPSDKAENKES